MNKSEIINKCTRSIHKIGFQLKKHSPEILVVAGVVGVVTSAVMACKATTKIDEILDDTKDKVDAIHDGMENGEIEGTEYTKEDGKKDLTIVYTQTGLKFAKLYGPSVVLGAASIGCILASHKVMRTRNAALAAAYAAVDKGFKEYRGRIVERFGEDLDRELKYNIKAKEVEEIVTDENGEEKTVKTTVNTPTDIKASPYSRIFDETSDEWQKDAEYNKMFLLRQERYANDKLISQGYLFLNDVYEMLGFDKTKMGQTIGWIYDPKNPVGSNYVDFGIYRLNNEASRRFVNGFERSILLDFNVDGDILNDPRLVM